MLPRARSARRHAPVRLFRLPLATSGDDAAGAFGAPLEHPPVRLRRNDAPLSVSSSAIIFEPPGPPFVQYTTGSCSSRQARHSLRPTIEPLCHQKPTAVLPVLPADGPGGGGGGGGGGVATAFFADRMTCASFTMMHLCTSCVIVHENVPCVQDAYSGVQWVTICLHVIVHRSQ
jgi:hypothetical protein